MITDITHDKLVEMLDGSSRLIMSPKTFDLCSRIEDGFGRRGHTYVMGGESYCSGRVVVFDINQEYDTIKQVA
jgi:hypothetical protein